MEALELLLLVVDVFVALFDELSLDELFEPAVVVVGDDESSPPPLHPDTSATTIAREQTQAQRTTIEQLSHLPSSSTPGCRRARSALPARYPDRHLSRFMRQSSVADGGMYRAAVEFDDSRDRVEESMPPFPKPRFHFEYELASEVQHVAEVLLRQPGTSDPPRARATCCSQRGTSRTSACSGATTTTTGSWPRSSAGSTSSPCRRCTPTSKASSASPSTCRRRFDGCIQTRAGTTSVSAFVFDGDKLTLSDEIGEVTPTPNNYSTPGVTSQFNGFDRTPYLGTFTVGTFTFSLVTAHLFFGGETAADMNRRSLEAAAVAWWTDRRHRNKYAPTKDVLALGDFNLPKVDPGDPIYRALTRKGLRPPQHSTLIGSNLNSDMHYDQIMFFPGDTDQNFTGQAGVVDFDGAVFRDLWTTKTSVQFQSYVKYFLSDHRPYWAEFPHLTNVACQTRSRRGTAGRRRCRRPVSPRREPVTSCEAALRMCRRDGHSHDPAGYSYGTYATPRATPTSSTPSSARPRLESERVRLALGREIT